jgi:hypothetical protein
MLLATAEVPQVITRELPVTPAPVLTVPIPAPSLVTRARAFAQSLARNAHLSDEGAVILERHWVEGFLKEVRDFSSDPDRLAEDNLWKVLSQPGDNAAAARALAQRVRSYRERRDAARHDRLKVIFLSLAAADRASLADYRRRHPAVFANMF